jgi:hypothetical protein
VGTRTGLAGLLIVIAAAGCGGTGAAHDPAQQRVLDCLRTSGWVAQSAPRRDVVILEAADGHAKVELFFWPNEADARRAVPDLAPIGVGWRRNVSFRSSYGFTYADEQVVERCL